MWADANSDNSSEISDTGIINAAPVASSGTSMIKVATKQKEVRKAIEEYNSELLKAKAGVVDTTERKLIKSFNDDMVSALKQVTAGATRAFHLTTSKRAEEKKSLQVDRLEKKMEKEKKALEEINERARKLSLQSGFEEREE